MATSIVFDAATESNGNGDTAGVEPFDHTVGNYEDRILWVVVASDDGGSGTVSNVTYNGVSLSHFTTLTAATGVIRMWVGYLVAPATGTHAVNVEWSPAAVNIFRVCAVSFYGVYQTSPLGQSNTVVSENTIPTDFTTSVTPDYDSGMIIDFYHGSRGSAGNAKTPQTETTNITGLWTGGVNHIVGTSHQPHTGSATDMVWENLVHDSGSADQLHAVIELREKPVGDAGTIQIV